LGLLALWLVACATTGAPLENASMGWMAGRYPEGLTPDTHVLGVGSGGDEVEARAAALRSFMGELFSTDVSRPHPGAAAGALQRREQQHSEEQHSEEQHSEQTQAQRDARNEELVVAFSAILEPLITIRHQGQAGGEVLVLLAAEKAGLGVPLTEAADSVLPDDAETLGALGNSEAFALSGNSDPFRARLRHWVGVQKRLVKRELLCTAAAALGAERCASHQPTDQLADVVQAQLDLLAAGLVLHQVPASGWLVEPGQIPEMPLTIQLLWKGPDGEAHPVGGAGLRVHGPDALFASSTVRTDGQGLVDVAAARPVGPAESVRVELVSTELVSSDSVSTGLLEGMAASDLPTRQWPIVVRPLSWNMLSVGLIVDSSNQPQHALIAAAAKELQQLLARYLSSEVVVLDSETSANVDLNPPVDLTVSLDVDWAFASALGARSLWYRARCDLVLKSTWNDATLITTEHETQGSGIGDQHAALQAVRKLMRGVSADVIEHLRGRYP